MKFNMANLIFSTALLNILFVFCYAGERFEDDECVGRKQKKDLTFWVDKLNLVPYPGATYSDFKFISPYNGTAPRPNYPENAVRPFGTSSMTIFTAETQINFHKLPTDSTVTWIHGNVVRIYYFDKNGLQKVDLGLAVGRFMFTTRAGMWSTVLLKNPKPGKFGIVSASMYPGIDLTDIQYATRKELIAKYPGKSDIITQFTPDP